VWSYFKSALCLAGLPHTKLGEILESRVNEFLKNSGAGQVTIRVVSSVDKVAEIKPGMKPRYALVY
jgi:E1A/CREB-binding protein